MFGLIASSLVALLGFQSASATPVPSAGLQARQAGQQAAPHFAYYSDKTQTLPDASALAGWNAFLLSFWLSTSGAADDVSIWAGLSAADRTTLYNSYNAAGIKVFISLFGETDTPTSSDPTTVAQNVAAFVQATGPLDGVDVDYEDTAALQAGTGVPWLVTFTNELRSLLGADYIITHAPQAPYFRTVNPYGAGYAAVDQQTNGAIDWYNVQYYNQGTGAYTTCDELITASANQPGSAVLEIIAQGISGDKVVLGKPGSTGDAGSGYVDPTTLAGCVSTGKSSGWNGGLMVWEYPDAPAGYVSTVWGA